MPLLLRNPDGTDIGPNFESLKMHKDGHRALLVLQEVEQNPILTQRSLSKKLGLALGLTNLYLKRLVRKGYIKITTIPRNRIQYLLTPRGMKEKSRLTYEYLQYSLSYYRDIRHQLAHTLVLLEQAGAKRIVIFGVGELAELAYLSIQESDLELVGFIADGDGQGDRYLSFPCGTLESLPEWDFDGILISDPGNKDRTRALIRSSGISPKKIFSVV